MKAIVLAAGYATRLRPLTDRLAKPLLPVGGRPLVDWIADRIDAAPDVDALLVVTNDRYAADFERWAAARKGRLAAAVVNDGTRSNQDRLGAIGDVRLTIERAGLAGDDLLVIAGDNLFDFGLAEYVSFWRERGTASCVALYQLPDRELARQYGVVEIDDEGRVVDFLEKPSEPRSDLVATASYIYHREHVPLIEQYLAEGNSPDQPGRFIAWLRERRPVYGYRFDGMWLDIGGLEQLLEADNLLRGRSGLPPREAYSLDAAAG